MRLSCTVFELERVIRRKWLILSCPTYPEFRRDLWRQKTSPRVIVWRCLRDPKCSRFDAIPECDGHAHTHTTAYSLPR